MKTSITNFVKSIVLFSIFFSQISAQAQAPRKFSYQAVIRNSSNALVANTNVGIRVSILQGSETGNASYVETHTATTNANGLVNLQIGGGTADSGSFTNINWKSGIYFVKTETDITGGTNYNIVGSSQLLSVPYALSSADNRWATNPNGINNTDGNVGIGTNTPATKLDVLGGNWNLTGTSAGDFRVGDAINNFKLGVATGGGGAGHTTMTSTSILSLGTGITDPNVRTLNIAGGKVGVGTISPTTKLEVNGFTKLGSDAPAIKIKKLIGITSDIEGGATYILHGLNFAKILSVTALVNFDNTQYFPPNLSTGIESNFNFYLDINGINIINSPTNSDYILSKQVKILITYEE